MSQNLMKKIYMNNNDLELSESFNEEEEEEWFEEEEEEEWFEKEEEEEVEFEKDNEEFIKRDEIKEETNVKKIDLCQTFKFYSNSDVKNILNAPLTLDENQVILLKDGMRKIHLGILKVFHATSTNCALRIIKEKKMKSGTKGMFGAGIYFAATKNIAIHKCAVAGHKYEQIFICKVDFGNALIFEKPFKNITREYVQSYGCDSIMGRSAKKRNWEFVVYDSNRIKILTMI